MCQQKFDSVPQRSEIHAGDLRSLNGRGDSIENGDSLSWLSWSAMVSNMVWESDVMMQALMESQHFKKGQWVKLASKLVYIQTEWKLLC